MNWLPLCGEVDGLAANRGLFEQYHIPMPTDYDSLVAACQAFEKVGIRGFVADFAYDYTCMEVLQGLSIPEITSTVSRIQGTGLGVAISKNIIDMMGGTIEVTRRKTGERNSSSAWPSGCNRSREPWRR